ncbi:hypothetical protein QN416_23520, partial [Glaciimonas sp. Cout2]|uniref:hypothetical protein n=1 Tax=Glaciimonas sp. Cout2 TaxID=3048621 RepID=UPI002B227EFB
LSLLLLITCFIKSKYPPRRPQNFMSLYVSLEDMTFPTQHTILDAIATAPCMAGNWAICFSTQYAQGDGHDWKK